LLRSWVQIHHTRSTFINLINYGIELLTGIEEAMLIDVGTDYIVIFMLVIVLAFIGNALLGIAIWRSGTLPKWAGAIWIAWAVMFYVAGVLSGFLFTSSSLPTQPIGSLMMVISGGWIAWGVFRQPSHNNKKHNKLRLV
jgi:hypothetical protein